MRYFLDGYNFLFRKNFDSSGGNRPLERARALFLEAIAKKNQIRGLDIRVFFDAKTSDPFPSFSTYSGMQIVYCSSYESADAALVEEVETARNPKEITVVTEDRALLTQVRVLGAKSLSPSEFLSLLSKKKGGGKKLKSRPTLIFPSTSPPTTQGAEGKKVEGIESEFQRWLRLFTEKENGA